MLEHEAATSVDVPTTRPVRRIVFTAVFATVLLIGLLLGGYTIYHSKTSEISDLKKERQHLRATNAALNTQVSTTRVKLARANFKLTKATKRLLATKRTLTKMNKDLAAANARANANYNAGYGAGNDAGYSSGESAGLVAGSDSLSCSDDPDVTWLPYCN
jgi:peptidoglycan hydrolase CwlO-like protein